MSAPLNPYAPPASVVTDMAGSDCWRDGRYVVLRRGSDLPPRCVRCNAPALQPVKQRRFYWYSPLLYILLFINVLLFAIVALVVRKSEKASPGLCAGHDRRRRRALTAAVLVFTGGMALLGAGGAYGGNAALILSGLLVLLAALVVIATVAALPTAARIDKHYLRLRGCGPLFRDSLPDFVPGMATRSKES
jgi:hypothetical protein